MSGRVTRRQLGALLAAAPLSAYQPLTAAQVVERIQDQLARENVPRRASFFDGFHLGDPTIAVTGIAGHRA